MVLFGHHANGFLEVEIMGHPFPDGPTEHVLAAVLATLAVGLMVYGTFAGLRDLWRWRLRREQVRRR